jgi:hypothetical protein
MSHIEKEADQSAPSVFWVHLKVLLHSQFRVVAEKLV